MLSKLILAIIIGIVTALVIYLIGLLVVPVNAGVGTFIESVSYLLGLLAALWWFFASGRTTRPLL